jgi:hypothetical protein
VLLLSPWLESVVIVVGVWGGVSRVRCAVWRRIRRMERVDANNKEIGVGLYYTYCTGVKLKFKLYTH